MSEQEDRSSDGEPSLAKPPPAGEPRAGPQRQVLLLCAAPALASGLRRTVEGSSGGARCDTVADPDSHHGAAAASPDAVVIAPQAWEEMEGWLPWLAATLAPCPWLFFAPPRIAGLFWSALEGPLRTIVLSGAAPGDVTAALDELLGGRVSLPAAALPPQFDHTLRQLPSVRRFVSLTGRELQCGCGVSLGLTNRRLARLLSIDEETVKDHVSALYRELRLSDEAAWRPLGFSKREALGALFHQAALTLPRGPR